MALQQDFLQVYSVFSCWLSSHHSSVFTSTTAAVVGYDSDQKA
jgi:hypothetical protein